MFANSTAWIWTLGLSAPVALASVAVLGYLFGRRGVSTEPHASRHSREIQRARRIARQLEAIADTLRHDLAFHRIQVERFKRRLRQVTDDQPSVVWKRLQEEAEAMHGPTLQLVTQLSMAYDSIRRQSQALIAFTGGRTDPVTGLNNSRALEEQIEGLLKSRQQEGSDFAVALIKADDADESSGDSSDLTLQRVANLLVGEMRDDDFAARFGMDDLVILMPEASLEVASLLGKRLRQRIKSQLDLEASCGLTESLPDDTVKSVLARADSALYSARASGPGGQFRHTGSTIRADSDEIASPLEGNWGDAEDLSMEDRSLIVSGNEYMTNSILDSPD